MVGSDRFGLNGDFDPDWRAGMTFHTNLENDSFFHKSNDDQINDLSFEIFGSVAPVLEVTLKPTQGLVCDRGGVLQRDAKLEVKPWPGFGKNRQLIVNSQISKALQAVLMLGKTGVFGAFSLAKYGGKLICPATGVVGNGPGVSVASYARFPKLGVHLVQLEGSGLVFLAARGDVFVVELAPGEQTCVRGQCVAAMTATVDFDPEAGDYADSIARDVSEACPEFVTLTGPGTIWVQSIVMPSLPPRVSREVFKERKLPEMADAGLAFAARNES